MAATALTVEAVRGRARILADSSPGRKYERFATRPMEHRAASPRSKVWCFAPAALAMILLTGATGVIGSALLQRLVSDGDEVRCLVRDPEAPGPEPGPGPDHPGGPGKPRRAAPGRAGRAGRGAPGGRDPRPARGHDRGAERPRHRAPAALRRVRGSRALRLLRRAGCDPQLAHALLSRQGAGRAGRRGVVDRRHRAVPLDRLRPRRPVHVAAAPALAAALDADLGRPGARRSSRCGPRTRPSAPSTRCAAAPPTAPAGSSLPARRS